MALSDVPIRNAKPAIKATRLLTGGVKVCDIAELSPPLDRGKATARRFSEFLTVEHGLV